MSERPTQTPASSAPPLQASGAARSEAPSTAARPGVHIDVRHSGAPVHAPVRLSPSAPTGESLAARAERFRNGAPFLVERATLYDPDPLDLPVAPADRRPRAPRTLLPAALTLLGYGIAVALAAVLQPVFAAYAPGVIIHFSAGSMVRVGFAALLVAILAGAWPAWRVLRVDPTLVFSS